MESCLCKLQPQMEANTFTEISVNGTVYYYYYI